MEKKTSKNILLVIMGVLILAEIAITGYEAVTSRSSLYFFINLAALVGVALYGFWFYKKPHGNMLKYAMLLSALSIVVSTIWSVFQWDEPFIEIFLPIFASCLMFYVAGRLNRIDQNKYLLPIIAAILFSTCVIDWISFCVATRTIKLIRYLAVPNQFITLLTLMIAYFVRYKEHKEAGLADAPKE